MINKKLVIAALAVVLTVANAQAAEVEDVASNVNATTYTSSDRQINYMDKNLANYQDPYLTNPRAYKSNQYGQASPPPKPNAFYSEQVTGYYYQSPEIRSLEEEEAGAGDRNY